MASPGAKLGIAADHAGRELKQLIADFVRLKTYEVIDYGVAVDSDKSVDYPDYAAILAADVASGKLDRGVLICGTGIGMCITANKFKGVRAAPVWDEFTARMSRAHNDANVICLGARVLNHHRAAELVNLWLDTEFEGNRHQARLDKIREIEKKLYAR
jgi:ribose 5-phosphate isomerase B